ncbi:MAG: RpiB/LacA/LacB family sugar-phosphate isomerase, partial [Proteobacteria bacterium]|nr:RpiB/LacA/LacB family sugar-phosphate isomerase [Pseudomonadota bacterium]
AVKDGRARRGVLICGTGIGISIAANRHPGIRAAPCHDTTTARLARQHNDANVLALGGRLLGIEVARDCLRAFLDTPFEGGRHVRRVAKLG